MTYRGDLDAARARLALLERESTRRSAPSKAWRALVALLAAGLIAASALVLVARAQTRREATERAMASSQRDACESDFEALAREHAELALERGRLTRALEENDTPACSGPRRGVVVSARIVEARAPLLAVGDRCTLVVLAPPCAASLRCGGQELPQTDVVCAMDGPTLVHVRPRHPDRLPAIRYDLLSGMIELEGPSTGERARASVVATTSFRVPD